MWLSTSRGVQDIDAQTVTALQNKWRRKDVVGELNKMHLWLLRKPSARPTMVWRFIDNWLARAPDSLYVIQQERPLTIAEQRRRNMDNICGTRGDDGRTIDSVAERVGGEAISAFPRLVRQSGSNGLG